MVKVTVLGAGGGVGQALSLQLRLSSYVDELALFDRHKAAGVAIDLSHIPVNQMLTGYKAHEDGLEKALKGADLVIVSAGPPVLPSGVTTNRNDLLNFNARVIGPLIKSCGDICPKSLIMIVTNPVNAIVPFAAEILRKQNAFDARRLFGVTTLDVVRAETFLADMLKLRADERTEIRLDVIGGHSAETMIPLFSQVSMSNNLSNEQLDNLIHRTQQAGMEVFLAKDRKCAATLSTAFATFRMAERLCRALKGTKRMRECTLVSLPGIEGGKKIAEALGVDFFSVPVEFTAEGASSITWPPEHLSEKEREMIGAGATKLIDDVKLGSELGKSFCERFPETESIRQRALTRMRRASGTTVHKQNPATREKSKKVS